MIPPDTESPIVEKQHFNTFDTFRFLAFFKVFLQHVPITAFAWFSYLRAGGTIGVQFFFTLSGFLITYIIYKEKTQTGTINLKNFFARRILRIWPLFYLVLGICYIVPLLLKLLLVSETAGGYEPHWWISVLFLENYRMIFTHNLPNVLGLAVTWSLCVEEHFYIIWGFLLFFVPAKHFLKIVFLFVLIGLIARIIFYHYDLDPSDILTNIDLFAFGSIPAYLLITDTRNSTAFLQKLSRMFYIVFIIFVIAFVLLASQVQNKSVINIWLTSISGIVFSMLIFLTISNSKAIRPVPVLEKAGVYTYGLYMYHLFIIVFLVRVFRHYQLSLDTGLNAILFFASAMALTIICSILSYTYFEKPFLKLKRLFR